MPPNHSAPPPGPKPPRASGRSLGDMPALGSATHLWEGTYFTLTYNLIRNIVIMRRKPLVVEVLEDYVRECGGIEQVMRRNDGARGIVIDMREAQPRQDAAFERATNGIRTLTFEVYPNVAMLFRSVAGALQMRRLDKGWGEQLLSTTNEAEAIAFASRLRSGRSSKFPKDAGSVRGGSR